MSHTPSHLTITIAACCLGTTLLSAQDTAWRDAPNLLSGAVPSYSIDDGATFSPDAPSLLPRTQTRVTIELPFTMTAAAYSVIGAVPPPSLALYHDQRDVLRELRVLLNGEEPPLPLDSMIFAALPDVDAGLLRHGDNVLRVEMAVWNGSRQDTVPFDPTIALVLRQSSEIGFSIGPVLGAFDDSTFTVSSRTNMPARMSVYHTRDGASHDDGGLMRRVGTTERGLLHRLRVPRMSRDDDGSYIVVAERDGFTVGAPVPTPIEPSAVTTFVVVGDSRTNVAQWQAVAAAIARHHPELVLHLGDLVTSGRRDWEWEAQFWRPAAGLLGSVPFYPVIGNHEADAPLYDALFTGPSADGGARNWAQRFGDVLLIGIDGGQDWSKESENARWLDTTLVASDAKFTFLLTHYPGWSSAGHGRLTTDGHPAERPARETRETVLPILTRHGGTAIIAGHDHVYERSELPGGMTAVTCGGGGAGMYGKTADAKRQNPYSVHFADRHHYCVFEVGRDGITMRVVTVDDEVIDERTWPG
jgi:predicted phosphodiesterase